MIRRSLMLSLSLGLAAALAATASFAATPSTQVTLQPGDNVVNLSLPASAPAIAAAGIAVATAPRISAPNATCSAYRAANPTSALTRAYCAQAHRKAN